MHLKGNRTFGICAVIALLALCQYFLKLSVPQEVWMSLFAIAIAALRAGLNSTQGKR